MTEKLPGTIGTITLAAGGGTAYEEFGRMNRGRRRELGMIQVKLAAQVRLEEKPVSAGYIHDLERGWVIASPHVMEQLAVALELDRDLLYLAVGPGCRRKVRKRSSA